MLTSGFQLVSIVANMAGEVGAVAVGAVVPPEMIDIRPTTLRRLLLTMDHSIQRRIPEILGDDHEERVDTLVRLLRGTSPEDLALLLGAMQDALAELEDERVERRRRREVRRLATEPRRSTP